MNTNFKQVKRKQFPLLDRRLNIERGKNKDILLELNLSSKDALSSEQRWDNNSNRDSQPEHIYTDLSFRGSGSHRYFRPPSHNS